LGESHVEGRACFIGILPRMNSGFSYEIKGTPIALSFSEEGIPSRDGPERDPFSAID
jgi:hypothetical protein